MDEIDFIKQNSSDKNIVLEEVRKKGVLLEWASKELQDSDL